MNLAGRVDEDIDLATDTELGLVDAGLDRKASSRQDQSLLVSLEIVHVCPVAVDFLADVMAGAMDEELAVSRLCNHLTAGVVHLPTLQRSSLGEGGADARHRGVAGLSHDGEDLLEAFGHGRRRCSRPG